MNCKQIQNDGCCFGARGVVHGCEAVVAFALHETMFNSCRDIAFRPVLDGEHRSGKEKYKYVNMIAL